VEEKKPKLTEEEIEQEMLEYLENKYDVEFENYAIEYAWWGQPGQDSMLAYVKGDTPNNYFPVHRNHNNDGSVTYEDGYIGHQREAMLNEKTVEIVNRYIPECVVRFGYGGEVYPENMPVDISLKDFQEYLSKKVSIACGIYVDESKLSEEDAKVLLPTIIKALKKEFGIGMVSIAGYSSAEYKMYIYEDYHKVVEEDGAYGDTGKIYTMKDRWGEIDQDYQYYRSDI
jgi:hypothetical protein